MLFDSPVLLLLRAVLPCSLDIEFSLNESGTSV